jgi:hypothetical protein
MVFTEYRTADLHFNYQGKSGEKSGNLEFASPECIAFLGPQAE